MWLRTMASIDHLGVRDDRAIRIRKVFDEIGLLRSVRPIHLVVELKSHKCKNFTAVIVVCTQGCLLSCVFLTVCQESWSKNRFRVFFTYLIKGLDIKASWEHNKKAFPGLVRIVGTFFYLALTKYSFHKWL